MKLYPLRRQEPCLRGSNVIKIDFMIRMDDAEWHRKWSRLPFSELAAVPAGCVPQATAQMMRSSLKREEF